MIILKKRSNKSIYDDSLILILSNISKWLEKNNRYTGLGLALITSAIVVVLSIYVYGEIVFLVPIVTFFSFHYTKLYKLKPRFLGSVVVFMVAAIIASALVAHIDYGARPTYEALFPDGSVVLGNVTPYASTSDNFVYNITIIENGSANLNLTNIRLNIVSSGYSRSVSLTGLQVNSTTIKYSYSTSTLPSGIYRYNISYTEPNGTVVYSGPLGGPVHDPEFILFEGYVPTYLLTYLIYFELIFAVGVFIGRSIGNSMRYSQQRRNQPPSQ